MPNSRDTARAIPVLASLDIAQSKNFYAGKLGFREIVYEDANYLIVRRDDMEVHFWRTDNPIFPKNTSCYIRGGQIVDLFEEYRHSEIEGLSALEVRPWDMKEFHIHDPHGNLLRFGAAPEET